MNGCQAKLTRSFLSDLLKHIENDDIINTVCIVQYIYYTHSNDFSVISQFNKAVVRSYVEGSGWLTWCRNPQGCDHVLYRRDGTDSGTCNKCKWTSCFSCNFIEVMAFFFFKML